MEFVTVSEAAQLWRVARSTVYGWIRQGIAPSFTDQPRGEAMALREAVWHAAVLRPRELLAHGVTSDALSRAVAAGFVAPRQAGGVSRYSLDDAARVRDFDGPAALPMRPTRPSGIVPTHLWLAEERTRTWAAEGADPAKLADEAFDGESPESFIPPAGIFLHTRGEPVPDKTLHRYVERTGGYDADLCWCDPDKQFAILKDGEPLPKEMEELNKWYRAAKRQRREEANRRKLRRLAETVRRGR